jgi:hypothetical protein
VIQCVAALIDIRTPRRITPKHDSSGAACISDFTLIGVGPPRRSTMFETSSPKPAPLSYDAVSAAATTLAQYSANECTAYLGNAGYA